MSKKGVRWAFNTYKWQPSTEDIKLATSCIQQEEKQRLSRFVFKRDFKSSLIGRLMMRKFVHKTTHVPYNIIKFTRDEKGKPVLTFPTDIELAFNVSHQGDYVILAGEVGVDLIGTDIMKIEYKGGKSLSEFFRIMSRQFSHSEWVRIKSMPKDSDQLAMFYRHWCLKESYVKAIGVGITVSLQDISFKINTLQLFQGNIVRDTELFINNEKQNWIFEETLIDNNHCAAVALRKDRYNGDGMNTFEEINFDSLIVDSVPLLQSDDVYCTEYFQKLEHS